MSFKKYGGLNYSARNNIVQNNYTNANNLGIMNVVGQPDSSIYFESTIVSPELLMSPLSLPMPTTTPTITTQTNTQTITQEQYDEITTKLNNHELLIAYLLRENQQLKTQIENLTSQ
jgi:hypothetical protein